MAGGLVAEETNGGGGALALAAGELFCSTSTSISSQFSPPGGVGFGASATESLEFGELITAINCVRMASADSKRSVGFFASAL